MGSSNTEPKEGAKILVVDDDPSLLGLLIASLNSTGYQVLAAADGHEALRLAQQANPDLVLLDIRLPGMSGYELTAALKSQSQTKHISVIMMTGWPELSDRPAARDAGADELLIKPFDALELRTRVRNTLAMRSMQQIVSRYVSDEVAAQIMASPSQYLKPGGEQRVTTVLFGDLRGFTSLAEQLSPEDVVTILNRYLELIVDIVFSYEGTLDKFRGDGIMAIFGTPIAHPDDPQRAVCAALEMQVAVNNLRFPQLPDVRLCMGIGINTGTVIAGNLGSPKRMDYTVVGDTVNLAERFQSNAGPGQILITDTTYQLVRDQVEVRDLGTLRVRGRTEWEPAYQLLSLKGPSLQLYDV
ncbi:MAG: response regulator, partial [Chloroflexi bacterium]|nr:response regulator [Chloroflexota bacterium]